MEKLEITERGAAAAKAALSCRNILSHVDWVQSTTANCQVKQIQRDQGNQPSVDVVADMCATEREFLSHMQGLSFLVQLSVIYLLWNLLANI